MTVKYIEVRHGNGEDLFYIRGQENGTDALFGWTAFRTREEAIAKLENFN